MDDNTFNWLVFMAILATPLIIMSLHWLLFPVRIMRRDVKEYKYLEELKLSNYFKEVSFNKSLKIIKENWGRKDEDYIEHTYEAHNRWDWDSFMQYHTSKNMKDLLDRINYDKLSKEDKELYDYANHYIIK